MNTNQVDMVDLVITALKEHERKLDNLINRMEKCLKYTEDSRSLGALRRI